jgi:hypothetical protein
LDVLTEFLGQIVDKWANRGQEILFNVMRILLLE